MHCKVLMCLFLINGITHTSSSDRTNSKSQTIQQSNVPQCMYLYQLIRENYENNDYCFGYFIFYLSHGSRTIKQF